MLKKIFLYQTIFFIVLTAAAGQTRLKIKNFPEITVDSFAYKDNILEYVQSGNTEKMEVEMQWIEYLEIAKPAEIIDADAKFNNKKYSEALKNYFEAEKKYKKEGWFVYSVLKQAEILTELKSYQDAEKKLASLSKYSTSNLKEQEYIHDAILLRGIIAARLNDYKTALPILRSYSKAQNERRASVAFMERGLVFEKNKDLKNASVMYALAATMFPKSEIRPKALLKTAQILEQMKDSRAKEFKRILKNEYPQFDEK